MNSLKVIRKGIEIILTEAERTRCEVWSRVMGYHRPTDQWNKGKQQEHCDRKHFKESCCEKEIKE